MTKKHTKIAIIGSGPAGLGAADSAKQFNYEYTVFEAQSQPFGHCKSFTLANHPDIFFDEGPHISFTKNTQVQSLFAESSPEFHVLQPKMLNFWQNQYIAHPVQNNLHEVPVSIRTHIIDGIKKRPVLKNIENYQDWLSCSFGFKFSELFHEIYTKKYWTILAQDMTTDWIGQRISLPSADEMIQSAENNRPTQTPHYFTHFRYPKNGGFESFLKKSFHQNIDRIQFHHAVEKIDLKAQKLRFKNGKIEHYDHLISSLPLDMMSDYILDCPKEIQTASDQLLATSVTLFSFVYKSKTPPPSHWMYIYDEDIPFARLYFPKALTNQADDSVQALQVEIYSSKKLPLTSQKIDLTNVINSLEKMNLLNKKDILVMDQKFCSHANVVFDHSRKKHVQIIHDYLKEHEVSCIGRFGEWAYLWSDDSYLSGFQAVSSLSR